MTDYITLEDLADYMDVPELLLQPAEMAIASAQDVVRGYLQQQVTYTVDDAVTLDGTATDALRLPQRPVVDVTLVTEDGSEMAADAYFLRDSTLYRIDGGEWYWGRARYEVTYSHGWAAPLDVVSDGPAEVPADIRLVTLGVARRAYDSLGEAPSGGEQTEQIGAYSYTNASGSESVGTELLRAEERVLSKYKFRKAA